jgi:phospholipase A1
VSLIVLPAESFATTAYDECVLQAVSEAPADLSVGKIREKCLGEVGEKVERSNQLEKPSDSPLKHRLAIESIAQELPFLLVPHKRNYVLPIAYNQSPNSQPFEGDGLSLDRAEVKLQFSLKSRVAKGLFFGKGDLWLAYTNLSFWQAYNGRDSAPFRETNHEPELFLDFQPSFKLGEWSNNLIRIGAVHQSNGRGGNNSRSWNRIYGMFIIENGNLSLGLRPWYRIPESENAEEMNTRSDDNPDIHKFLGYGEVFAFYRGEKHRVGATFRNNLRSDNRIGLQLDWSYPVFKRTRLYLQYFNGFGESLIDYNDSTNRLSLGFLFSETL